MAPATMSMAEAKDCFRHLEGKTRTISLTTAAGVAAQADITLPIKLKTTMACPIVSIALLDATGGTVYKYLAIGDGTTSDQVVYDAGDLPATGQFCIKDASTIILGDDFIITTGLLVITADWDD